MPKPKEQVPQALINYIEAAMEMQDVSLRKVAERAQLDPATLSRILAGQQGLPTDETLIRLGHALKLANPSTLVYLARRVPEDDPLFVELLEVAVDLAPADFRVLLRTAKTLRRDRKAKERKLRRPAKKTGPSRRKGD